ncbi:hypothetical protein Z043-112239 [Arapaima gigas]
MELVPTRVGLSRRLLIILTPAAQGSCVGSMSEMYGPPAGLALHQALVQDELKVILIELQSTGTSEHLPSELQHLVRKSTPLLNQDPCSFGFHSSNLERSNSDPQRTMAMFSQRVQVAHHNQIKARVLQLKVFH